MRRGISAGFAAFNVLALAGLLPGQTNSADSLSKLVLSELPGLDTGPNLASWRRTHAAERLKAPAYDNEYETQGLWCSASVSEIVLPGGVKATRNAFFYVPPRESSGALPDREDANLVQQCRLLAFWYQLENPPDRFTLMKSVSEKIAASLGSPEAPGDYRKRDPDWGSGLWNPYLLWELPNRRIVLAVDPGSAGLDPKDQLSRLPRLLVIVRARQAPRGASFDWLGELPKGQPSLQKAAGERTGDPKEIADVKRAETPCAFDDGRNNWEGGEIAYSENVLHDFPMSRWKPWIHLTMARAYTAKLLLTYPGIDLNGANKPTDPGALRRNAIANFRIFLDEAPEAFEAPAVWRETWRLLPRLPPSPLHFACTD
jgi:hypothetical protein